MDHDVADAALLQQCGLSGCSRIIWDIKSSSDSSIDLQEDFCSEPSHCSDVDEQPRLEETRLELSDDDTGSGQDPSLELEEDEMEASWAPGSSVGDWFPKGQPMNESSQVIILNVYLSLTKLPIGTLKDIVSALGGTHAATVPFALRAAAGLLCLSPIRIYRTVIKVKQNGWGPVPQPSCNHMAEPVSGGRAQDNDGMQVQKSKQVLLTLTRAALGTRSAHAPASEYVKHIARLAVEGVDVGHKYHTREHFKDVEFLAARCLQSYDAQDIRRPLSGLGIRSDFAILMDGVPVGGVKAYGRHGTVVVICLSGVSPHTHRLHAKFIAWCKLNRGHGGEETAVAVANALAAQPIALTLKELRASLSLVGGDGAAVAGGPDRKNPGTQAGELLWNMVHPAQARDEGQLLVDLALPIGVRMRRRSADEQRLHLCTEWDKFHREDIALSRAIKKCALAGEVYEVCAAMDAMFHHGDGKLLLQTAARAVGEPHRSGWMPGMTRKAVGLASEPGNLLANFAAYVAGLHARMEWKREGHGQHNVGTMIEIGRRLTTLDFVAFTLLFRDIMRRAVAPWSAAIQSASLEPWALQRKQEEHESTARQMLSLLRWMRELARVCVLLRQLRTSTLCCVRVFSHRRVSFFLSARLVTHTLELRGASFCRRSQWP